MYRGIQPTENRRSVNVKTEENSGVVKKLSVSKPEPKVLKKNEPTIITRPDLFSPKPKFKTKMSSKNSAYTNYAKELNTNVITQDQKLDSKQVENSCGSFVWKIDDLTRLKRFITLGSEGGTYYIHEKELTKENGECVKNLLDNGKGLEVVETIKRYSTEGRIFKQDQLIFVLAFCARRGDLETKKAAYREINKILRIPTHLFTFIEFCELLSSDNQKNFGTGWGRAHRRAISNWYLEKSNFNLVYLTTKYQSRNGWSHRDLLRLCHLKTTDNLKNVLFKYITKNELPENVGSQFIEESELKTIEYLKAFDETRKKTITEGAVLNYIKQFEFVREHIPIGLLNSVKIWTALLEKMPLAALIRNLGKMSSIGLFDSNTNDSVILVTKKLKCKEIIKKSRIHPISILIGLKTYASGHGVKGSLKWKPNSKIVDTLDSAFYNSFGNVKATEKRFLLALDVSKSMNRKTCSGAPISACEASTALSMITAATETKVDIMGFAHEFRSLNISPKRRLDDNLKEANDRNFGATDISLPMRWALEKKFEYDVFIVYTDNETNSHGNIHPESALKMYRQKMNIPKAKLIVIAMASNGFTIADPYDPGMLDVVGFDSSVPEVINEFVLT